MASAAISRPRLTSSASPAGPASALEISGVPVEEQKDLASKIEKVSLEWVSQIAQMQQLDVAFATKLTCCSRPGDAGILCGEWMARRVDSVVAKQHRLLELWLAAVTAAASRRVAARLESETAPERRWNK